MFETNGWHIYKIVFMAKLENNILKQGRWAASAIPKLHARAFPLSLEDLPATKNTWTTTG